MSCSDRFRYMTWLHNAIYRKYCTVFIQLYSVVCLDGKLKTYQLYQNFHFEFIHSFSFNLTCAFFYLHEWCFLWGGHQTTITALIAVQNWTSCYSYLSQDMSIMSIFYYEIIICFIDRFRYHIIMLLYSWATLPEFDYYSFCLYFWIITMLVRWVLYV